MRKRDNRIGALGETKVWLWALGKCVAVGIGRAESLCTVIYNPKRISLGMILYYGQICPCRAQASVHSSLYSHYKHLVLVLQAPCTGTTSVLYSPYKCLVLALQSACSVCTNNFSLHCKCRCVDALMAKWGMQTAF